MPNLKLKTQFLLLLVFITISFLLASVVGNNTFSKVFVNGPVYSKIVINKDLVADILPPPAYLLESWQVALEMTAIKNQSPLPLIEKSKQLEKDFLNRSKYWDEEITDPKMHEVIKTQLQPSGIEYLRILDNDYIPAIRSGNPKLIDSALVDLKASYEKHRAAVDVLSGLADAESKKIESGVIGNISNAKLTVLMIALLALMLIVVVIVLMMRSITKPLNKSIQVFTNIEEGNFTTPIVANGDNELSKVLQSLNKMQSKLSQDIGDQQALAKQVAVQSELYERQLAAISRSTGVIEFSLDGKVIAVNNIYLKALGYSLDEAIGQHHSKFVDEKYRISANYKAFWANLNRGEAITGEFEYVGKNGVEVWLQASYNPILDATGTPYKVVKYATDITEQKIKNTDFEGQITAIGKSQGVIEIGLDGTLLKANETYLKMLGYAENELVGKHVSIVE